MFILYRSTIFFFQLSSCSSLGNMRFKCMYKFDASSNLKAGAIVGMMCAPSTLNFVKLGFKMPPPPLNFFKIHVSVSFPVIVF